jgi:diguanylate cyclase (GGDEF)-like protein
LPADAEEALGEILIVDDSRVNVGVLGAILGGRGHAVRLATDGPSALEAVKRSPPDLILLDIRLPGLDGYEVCRRLRADGATRDIPVIFVSALEEGEDKLKAFAVGGSDYVPKPFQAVEVVARVENQLKLLRLQRQMARSTEELERANRTLESLSYLDPLTGLPSRRHFDESLEQEWRRARRQQTSLVLVLAEVDHFKAFAEAYGGQSADECLRRVAIEFSGSLRRGGDLGARFGAEGLAALLPATEAAGARVVAQEAAQRVLGLRIPHRASPIQVVSLSLGIAVTAPATSESASPEPLLDAAAQALQRARSDGGNRIVAAR